MNPHSDRNVAPQARWTLGLAAVLLLLWRSILVFSPSRAEFAECSYQQNLLRLETYRTLAREQAGRPVPVVLAGTSVSGRVLPKYFDSTRLAGVVNLGLDGSSPAFALEVLLREKTAPRLVLLETYLLHSGVQSNESLITASLDSPGAALADLDRMFRAEARPSAMLYTALKRSRELRSQGKTAKVKDGGMRPHEPSTGVYERLTNAISALRERGSEVVLVDIPVGIDWPPGPNLGEPVASLLVRDFGLKRMDCRADLVDHGIEPRFTDGIHLDATSAREVARAISDGVHGGRGRAVPTELERPR